MKIKREFKNTILIGAILFLMLGSGNMIYGRHKLEQFKIQEKEQSPQKDLPRSMQKITESKRLEVLSQRTAFYTVVKFGGEFFVSIGLIGILSWILFMKKQDQ